MDIIKVGMADLNVGRHPCMLTTLGLGSCVGVSIFDRSTKISGMAHIMLPSSKQARDNTNIAKFADTGIIELVNQMLRIGAKRASMVAKLAGGAQMFAFKDVSDIMRIGDRNVDASKEMLSLMKIPVIAEDVRANYGRTIELYSTDGSVLIKTIGHGSKTI
ncbi:MAG: chemotaxis protein CheD [Clostridiales bacterium]|jgi:chemotaxis protein CheD|nr:chemotaxis protein CheD [Clostridiales bacterium]